MVTQAGMVMLFKLEQPRKVDTGMVARLPGMLTVDSLGHS